MKRTSLVTSIPALFAALAIAVAAHAQERRTITRSAGGAGGAMGGGGIKLGGPSLDAPPPLSRERLLRYAKVLELSPEQTQAAEHLYNTYVDGVKKQQKDFHEKIERAREDAEDAGPPAMMKALSGLMQEQGSESTRMRDQFLTDLKSILEPAQAGNWDKLERLRRRDNWLARGVLSGSNVDLLNIIDSLKLPPASPPETEILKDTLALYELDLDHPLQEREAFLSAPGDGAATRSFNGDDLKKHLEDQRLIDAKVQDVNARYARQLAELVPADKRAEFEQLVKSQTFKRVYKESAVAKKAQAAANLAKLSQDQKDKIARALEQYKKNTPAVNDRWADAITRAEKSGQTPLAPSLLAGRDASPDLADAKKARRALDSDLKNAIEETLTPEQLADLPRPGQDQMGGGRTMIATFDSDDGRTGGPVTFVADDLDDDEEGGFAFLGGPGGGGGVMVIQQTTTNGNGETQTQVDVTTSAPAPGDKKKK